MGMGSDGASNMTGRNSGLAVRLRERFPEMFSVHCLCHRLELAFKDAMVQKPGGPKAKKQNYPVYEKMMTMLTGIFYLYKKSHKQKKGITTLFLSFSFGSIKRFSMS